MGQAIESIARSVATLLWPSILILAIVLFRKQFRAILRRIARSERAKVDLGKGFVKIEVEGGLKAAATLGAGTAVERMKSELKEMLERGETITAEILDRLAAAAATERDIQRVVASVATAAQPAAVAHSVGKRILWVDDIPKNNEYGVRALRAQGLEVVECRSTREALEEVKRGPFDVIITDMYREGDGVDPHRAGYVLKDELRKAGVTAPIILSTSDPNEAQAKASGFFNATNTQEGVFRLVLEATGRS
jgi:CheY-like chemotaxis protein